MAINIIERAIKPYNRSSDKITQKQGYSLYAPVATNKIAGMAAFDINDFTIDGKHVVKLSVQRVKDIMKNEKTSVLVFHELNDNGLGMYFKTNELYIKTDESQSVIPKVWTDSNGVPHFETAAAASRLNSKDTIPIRGNYGELLGEVSDDIIAENNRFPYNGGTNRGGKVLINKEYFDSKIAPFVKSVSYDNSTGKICFYNQAGGVNEFDLIQTSMLTDVKLDGKTLIFTFRTAESDKLKTVSVEIENVLKPFTPSDAGKVVSIDKNGKMVATEKLITEKEIDDIKNDIVSVKTDVANPVKGTAHGTVLKLSDVSPLTHNMDIVVKGKNLLRYIAPTELENRGVRYTVLEDGSIILNGKPVDKFSSFTYGKAYFEKMFVAGRTYTIGRVGERQGDVHLYVAYRDDEHLNEQYFMAGGTFTWKSTYTLGEVYIQVNGYDDMSRFEEFDNYRIYPQIVEGPSVPDDYISPVQLEQVKLYTCGKNLITNNPNDWPDSVEISGNAFFANTSEGKSGVKCLSRNFPKGTYAARGVFQGDRRFVIRLYDADNNIISDTIDNFGRYVSSYKGYLFANDTVNGFYEIKFTIPDRAHHFAFGVVFSEDNSKIPTGTKIKISHLQLELNSSTNYEQPVEYTDYTVASTGTVSGVTSLSPTTTLMTDNPNTTIDVVYNKDLNDALSEANVPTFTTSDKGKFVMIDENGRFVAVKIAVGGEH